VFASLKLLNWLLMNSTAPITWPSSYVNHCKNRFEDDEELRGLSRRNKGGI
jgi:hypothetical protein